MRIVKVRKRRRDGNCCSCSSAIRRVSNERRAIGSGVSSCVFQLLVLEHERTPILLKSDSEYREYT